LAVPQLVYHHKRIVIPSAAKDLLFALTRRFVILSAAKDLLFAGSGMTGKVRSSKLRATAVLVRHLFACVLDYLSVRSGAGDDAQGANTQGEP
jgi:hypothetical protein